MKEIKSFLQNKKSLTFTLLLSLLYILPLLLIHHEYLDDTGRNLYGYGWKFDGRFLATYLGQLWSLNGTIFSIYPFSLIIATVLLAVSGNIITTVFEIEKNSDFKFTSLLIVTSPFLLGNLVYKFDCLPMAMSIFTIVVPFLYWHNKLKFYLFSFVGIFISLGLYQSSATIYFIISSLFLVDLFQKQVYKSFIINSISVVGVFVGAYLIYLLILPYAGYDISHRSSLIFSYENVFELLKFNNKRYFDQMSIYYGSGYILYFYITLALISLIGIFSYIKSKNRVHSVALFTLILIVLTISYYLIASINIFLKESYWDFRSFSGLSFVLILCMYFQKFSNKYVIRVGRFICAIILIYSFILMAQFGRILQNQMEFNSFFVYEMNDFVNKNDVKKISFIGKIPHAPKNKLALDYFPIYEYFFFREIGANSYWTKNLINAYGTFDNIEFEEFNENSCESEFILEHRYYNLKWIDTKHLLIDFNKRNCL